MQSRPLELHPDRLFPVEPTIRAVARRIHAHVRDLPVISPHGHVEPGLLLENAPFADPASLLVTPDHYVTRLLHASGVPLNRLGVGRGELEEADARRVWRELCTHWPVFAGTPVRYWFEHVLVEVFGVTTRPAAETADAIYDQIAAALAKAEFRPRALFEQFGIEVLATTDDPCSHLTAHRGLLAVPDWTGRVIPTFRPDKYLDPGQPGWADAVRRLGLHADLDTDHYQGYITAIEQRRRYFRSRGATSADHSHEDVRTDPLTPAEAASVFRDALAGTATPAATTAFRRHMLLEMARMSVEDGLVMTLHPAVRRNHHSPTFRSHGADTGHDIPIRVEYTDALRPLLERYGTAEGFHLVLFTLDETVFSRELAPLAGFYPSVHIGAPWWFLDAPDAIRRWRSAITETAGFSRTSGFIDDTRAFCSIPARHDMSRRLDAGHLAQLVAEHRLTEDEALDIAVDLVDATPRKVFKL